MRIPGEREGERRDSTITKRYNYKLTTTDGKTLMEIKGKNYDKNKSNNNQEREREREREKVGLTLKMRLLLVDSHAKPPLKSIVQTNTKTSREIPSACTTRVNGIAGTPKAIASLSSSSSLSCCWRKLMDMCIVVLCIFSGYDVSRLCCQLFNQMWPSDKYLCHYGWMPRWSL